MVFFRFLFGIDLERIYRSYTCLFLDCFGSQMTIDDRECMSDVSSIWLHYLDSATVLLISKLFSMKCTILKIIKYNRSHTRSYLQWFGNNSSANAYKFKAQRLDCVWDYGVVFGVGSWRVTLFQDLDEYLARSFPTERKKRECSKIDTNPRRVLCLSAGAKRLTPRTISHGTVSRNVVLNVKVVYMAVLTALEIRFSGSETVENHFCPVLQRTFPFR